MQGQRGNQFTQDFTLATSTGIMESKLQMGSMVPNIKKQNNWQQLFERWMTLYSR